MTPRMNWRNSVLHRHGVPHAREVEREAQRFAAAFLYVARLVAANCGNKI